MIRALTACAVALTLAACTRIPTDLPSRPALRAPASAAALATLAGESSRTGTAALSERWWESFGLADLNRLVDIALKDRPDLAAAQSRLTLASQAERLARLQTEVNYATDAGMVREHLSKNGLFPPPMGGSTLTQTDVSQTLSYNLDWWGRNRALVHAAGNETRAVQADAAAVRLTVAAAVADAYFAWADTQARLGLINELTTRHRREYTLLKARFDLGLDAAQPVIEAQQQLDLDEDQMRALEYLDRSSRYRLAALIGADPDHAGELPSPRLDGRLADLPAALPLDWLSRRPDVTALRARVEAAADLSLSARADFYPNIDLRLMVGLETLDIGKLLHAGSLTGSLGPAVHLPLFNTATLTARLNQREAEYAAAVAAYNRVVLDGAGEAADAYALEGSLAQRAQAQARATREARNTFDLARHRLELGFATPLETLAADAAVLERQQGENAIRAARLRARVQLFKALGGGLSISKE